MGTPGFIEDLPDAATKPCVQFLDGAAESFGFIMFVVMLALRADEMQKTALQALTEVFSDDEQKLAEFKEQLAKFEVEGPSQKGMKKFVRLMLQMQITRTVDHYLAYIADLLSEVFLARPETLRSNDTVEVEYVLRHETMDDLVKALAERRVERLAYAGLKELADSLRKRPGLELFASSDELLRGLRIVEDRNLIVHNHAIVNNVYRRKVVNTTKAAGEKLALTYDSVMNDMKFLTSSVLATDRLAVAKWSLPTEPVDVSSWA